MCWLLLFFDCFSGILNSAQPFKKQQEKKTSKLSPFEVWNIHFTWLYTKNGPKYQIFNGCADIFMEMENLRQNRPVFAIELRSAQPFSKWMCQDAVQGWIDFCEIDETLLQQKSLLWTHYTA